MNIKNNIGLCCTIALFFICPKLQAEHRSYLNDVDTYQPGLLPMANHGYPRVILSETKVFKEPVSQYTKYNILTGQTSSKNKIAQIQSLNPESMYFWHVSPRAYQGYLFNNCVIGAGMAFEETGPTTQGGPLNRGCSIYAGHWLYKAGSTLVNSINNNVDVIKVNDISRFNKNQYVVIYDAPSGSFENAEHAKITDKDTVNSTLTLVRGFKSVKKSRSVGAIVAQHVIGQGNGDPRNWSYNLSTQSPKDANGNKASTAMANWFLVNLQKDKRGEKLPGLRVDGIQFDADFYDELTTNNTDANNDLVVDDGLSPTGQNWWGLGLENFYQQMRARFPDKIIISGNRKARGFGTLNGTQIEAFPAQNRTLPMPVYGDIDAQISRYSFHLHNNQAAPLHTHNLNKTPTKIYPKDSSAGETTNSVFRLGLGLTLMEDGYYGHENSKEHPDPWYDEYAVDIKADSINYGEAILRNPADESNILTNLGWLGQPLGDRYRVYDDALFDKALSLIPNGTFDADISDWKGRGKNVEVNHDTIQKLEGNGSLHSSVMTTFLPELTQTRVKGPQVSIIENQQYTLAFSARSTSIREFTAAVGTKINRFMVGPKWRRFVFTFKSEITADQLVWFGVGREKLEMWFDSVYLFKGNANILRRDFENGIVIANATPSPQSIDLEDTYLRIKGIQAVSINNGASIDSVNIAPWDAAILVRQQNSPCGRPQFNKITESALVVWKDCDRSNKWHVRGIAGASADSITYQRGIIITTPANAVFSSITKYDFESNQDSFVLTNNDRKINLTMKTFKTKIDGINFILPVDATVCFRSGEYGKLLIGKNRYQKTGQVCLD